MHEFCSGCLAQAACGRARLGLPLRRLRVGARKARGVPAPLGGAMWRKDGLRPGTRPVPCRVAGLEVWPGVSLRMTGAPAVPGPAGAGWGGPQPRSRAGLPSGTRAAARLLALGARGPRLTTGVGSCSGNGCGASTWFCGRADRAARIRRIGGRRMRGACSHALRCAQRESRDIDKRPPRPDTYAARKFDQRGTSPVSKDGHSAQRSCCMSLLREIHLLGFANLLLSLRSCKTCARWRAVLEFVCHRLSHIVESMLAQCVTSTQPKMNAAPLQAL